MQINGKKVCVHNGKLDEYVKCLGDKKKKIFFLDAIPCVCGSNDQLEGRLNVLYDVIRFILYIDIGIKASYDTANVNCVREEEVLNSVRKHTMISIAHLVTEHLPDVVDEGVVQEEDDVVGSSVQSLHVSTDEDVGTAMVKLQAVLGILVRVQDFLISVTGHDRLDSLTREQLSVTAH